MRTSIRFALSILSHGVLAVAGYAAYSHWHSTSPASPAPLPTEASGKTLPRTTGPDAAEVQAILDGLQPKPSAEPTPDYKAAYAQFREEAVRLMHELPEDPDLAASLEREIGAVHPAYGEPGWKPSPKVAALLYQQIMKDPAAIEGLMDPNKSTFGEVLRDVEVAVTEAMKTPEGLAKVLSPHATDLTGYYSMDHYIASTLAKAPDPTQIAQAKAAMQQADWSRFCDTMARTWPTDQRDSLLTFARDQNQPGMIATALEDAKFSNDGSSGGAAEWLTKTLSDSTLPEDFRQKLTADKNVAQIIATDPAAPLALRMQFAEGANDSEKYSNLCHDTVSHLWASEINWKGLVHSGDATAEEVLAAVSGSAPELASAAPGEFRDQVFAALAGENAKVALKLLDGMPADKRNETILNAASTQLSNATPDGFLSLLQQVPDDRPELWESRLDAWNHGVNWMGLHGGSDFTDWVQALPEGTDREMALYSLARRAERWDPDMAAQLRGLITDPKLQQMIADGR